MNYHFDCNCERPHCVCIVSVSNQDEDKLKVCMDFEDGARMRIDDIERREKRFVVHSLLLHCGLKEAIEKCDNDINGGEKRGQSLKKKVNTLDVPTGEPGERSYCLTYDSKITTMDAIMKICKMIDEFFENEISTAVSKTMVFTCCQTKSDILVLNAANEVIKEQYYVDLK
ncbi:hypothetical protein WA171_000776 [Blastocystis sp. BT1]